MCKTHTKTPWPESPFSLSCRPQVRNSIKTLTQVFSCEFWEIFKSIFFLRVPPVSTSLQLYRIWMNSKVFLMDFCYLFQNSCYVEQCPFRVTLSSYLSDQLFFEIAIFLNSCFSRQLFFITATYRNSHQRCSIKNLFLKISK